MKYQRSTTLGCKDIGIEKLEFVAKTQFSFINSLQGYSVHCTGLKRRIVKRKKLEFCEQSLQDLPWTPWVFSWPWSDEEPSLPDQTPGYPRIKILAPPRSVIKTSKR